MNLKFFLTLLIVGITCLNSLGQLRLVEGKTYALIVGVSDYHHPEIIDLLYAHKDAEEFRQYLISPAGGSVPDTNIVILTNENATAANIGNALNNLAETAFSEKDMLYLYFSGHGDTNQSDKGFFLPHDAPKSKTYIHNAIALNLINDIVNNISMKGTKVVLIIDSCHSGNIVGNEDGGNSVWGSTAETIKANEVRLASCKDHQKSQEGEGWGGGRGAFSYHLINGLKGIADLEGDQDDVVTKRELNSYLVKVIPEDLIRKGTDPQDPIIQGLDDNVISIVDPDIIDLAQREDMGETYLWKFPETTERAIAKPKSDLSHYMDFLYENFDKIKFDSLAKEQVKSFDIVTYLLDNFEDQDTAYDASAYTDKVRKGLLSVSLKKHADNFKNEFAAIVHSHVQKTIIELLDGFERTEIDEDISAYPDMLNTALKLVRPNRLLHSYIKVKLHYFKGINARRKMMTAENKEAFYTEAKNQQMAAMDVEKRAPYIYNELGTLHDIEGNFTDAVRIYSEAEKYAPDWAVPQAKMSNLYLSRKEFSKCLEIAQSAVENQKNNLLAQITRARCARAVKNYYESESSYLASISINDSFYLPIAELGDMYIQLNMLEKAEDKFKDLVGLPRDQNADSNIDGEHGIYDLSNVFFIEQVNTYGNTKLIDDVVSLEEEYHNEIKSKIEANDTISDTDALNLIEYYIMNNNMDTALMTINTLLLRNQGVSKELYLLKASISLIKEDMGVAIKDYLAVTASYPEAALAHYNLARIYSKNQKVGQSKYRLQQALQKGFDKKYVILNDPYLENLKNSELWQTLLDEFPDQIISP